MTQNPTEAVQLVSYNEEEGLVLNDEAVKRLQDLFKDKKQKDQQVAVLSVAGAYRRGKSFLLNFIIKYLTAQGKADWLGNKDEPLQGFQWAYGPNRNTVGIWVWPQLFPVSDQVSLLLMDSQGTFDPKTPACESMAMFALSAVLSSVQVYNLQERIQLDDLTNLQYFLSVGRRAAQGSKFSITHKNQLCFLIRDWKFGEQKSYGLDGGTLLLDEALKGTPDAEQVNLLLKDFYDKITCFLMPYPGIKVDKEENFSGAVTDIDEQFVSQLKNFLNNLLNLKSLKLSNKLEGSVPIASFIDKLTTTIDALGKDVKRLPDNMLEAISQLDDKQAIEEGKQEFRSLLKEALSKKRQKLWTDQLLDTKCELVRTTVLQNLKTRRCFSTNSDCVEERKNHIKRAVLRDIENITDSYRVKIKAIVKARDRRAQRAKTVGCVVSGSAATAGAVTTTGLWFAGTCCAVATGGAAAATMLAGGAFLALMLKPCRKTADTACLGVADVCCSYCCCCCTEEEVKEDGNMVEMTPRLSV